MAHASVTKAVILARGLGTRMQRLDPAAQLEERQSAAAASGVKSLIPVGHPFLDYALSALANAGCREACIVIAPGPNEIRKRYTEVLQPKRLRLQFAVQDEPRGTADALRAAREFAGDDLFLMVNSDNYYPVEVLRQLCDSGGPALAAFEREALLRESNIPRERVLQYAVLWIAADGVLERIVEKPAAETVAQLGAEVYVSMNAWVFGPEIFSACASIGPSPRGELELQSAVQFAIDRLGMRIRALKVHAGVLDLSQRSDIARVAERLHGIPVDL